MPTYRITDNRTGKSYKITGLRAPTQQEVSSLVASKKPKTEGFLKKAAKGIVAPFVGFGKNVAEAGFQAGRFATDPTFRKGALGKDLSEKEHRYLSTLPTSKFMDEDKMSRKGIATDITKNYAGVASTLTPAMGAGLPGVMAQGATSGFLRGVYEGEGFDPKRMAKGAAVGTLTAGAMYGAGQGIRKLGSIKKNIGGSLKKAGSGTLKTGYGRPAAISKFKGRFGTESMDDLISSGNITRDASGLAKLEDIMEATQGQYDDIVKNSGKQIDNEAVLNKVFERIDELKTEGTGDSLKLAGNLEKELGLYLNKHPVKTLDVSALTSQRKLYQKNVNRYVFGDTNKTVNQEMRDLFQKSIYEQTSDIGNAEILGKELSKLIEFRKILSKAVDRGGSTRMGSLGRTAVTGVGGMVGGKKGAIVANVADRFLNRPDVSLQMGKALKWSGKQLQKQKLPKEFLPTFARNIMRNVGTSSAASFSAKR